MWLYGVRIRSQNGQQIIKETKDAFKPKDKMLEFAIKGLLKFKHWIIILDKVLMKPMPL